MGQQGKYICLLQMLFAYIYSNFVYIFQLWVRRILRLCALLSLLSVSLNTPKSFEKYPYLQIITFVVDCTVTLLFTAEMIAKMQVRGVLKVRMQVN